MEKMTNSLKTTLKRFVFRGIRFKIAVAILLAAVVLMLATEYTMDRTVSNTVEQLMISRLEDDTRYVEALIGKGIWHIEDGALYRGDVLIGDGTEEHANSGPFEQMKDDTGSFSYVFIRCPDEGLKWVGDEKSGYQQGHFMRVSGSSLDANGKKIIGTYMDKNVADILDKNGRYVGQANVADSMVFCVYNARIDQNGDVVAVIVTGCTIQDLRDYTRSAEKTLFWIIMIAMLLVSVGLNFFLFRWIAKLDKVNNYLGDISTGVFPDEPLDLHTKDELMLTAQHINDMTESLREKARIGIELAAATNIQVHMLPCVFPAFPDRDEFDIYATMNPAKEVGGDFYDFFMIDERHLAVVIADVSGKGVPAALFMVIAKTLIKNHTQMGLEPCEVFTKVNRLLCEGNEEGLFVTAWMGVLDVETGKLTYVNAGHNPPMIKLADGGFTKLKSRPCFVLAGLDDTCYTQAELTMAPGDRLFLYTDGVTEATNEAMELYGEEQLSNYLNEHIAVSAEDMLHGLKDDINIFAGNAEQFDDITMLILDYRKKCRTDDTAERLFPAKVDALPEVTAFVEEALEKAECSPKAEMQIAVAVEELFVNIANYAYPDGDGSMKLKICTDDEAVTLRFMDSGIAFNPLQEEEPDVTADVESRKIGGLGIYMVKKTMDSVQYERKDNENILTVTKKLHAE